MSSGADPGPDVERAAKQLREAHQDGVGEERADGSGK